MGFSENDSVNPFAGAGAADAYSPDDRSKWLTSPATHPCLYEKNGTREYSEFGAHIEKDPLAPLWAAIDWTDTCVAGSFALNSFLRSRSLKKGTELGKVQPPWNDWVPDDLDIMIHCETRLEFEGKARALEHNLPGLQLTKAQWYPNDISERVRYFQTVYVDKGHLQTEIFHYCIRGMNTYSYGPWGRPIQLVCFSSRLGLNPSTKIEHILDAIVDSPSCVTFRVQPWGTKVFRVPDYVVPMLITRCVSLSSICSSRLEKYQQRGFRFVPGFEVYEPLIQHIKRFGYPRDEKHLENLLEGFAERALYNKKYKAQREVLYAEQQMAAHRAATSAAEILFRAAIKEAVEQRAREEQEELQSVLGLNKDGGCSSSSTGSNSSEQEANEAMWNFAVGLGELDLSDDDDDDDDEEHDSDMSSSEEEVVREHVEPAVSEGEYGVVQMTSDLNEMEL